MNANVDRQTLRKDILSATRQISELARTSAWHEALALVRDRRGLLESFFATGGMRDNHEEELIHAVLGADRMLADLASAVRRETLTELDLHLHKRKALVAYDAERQSNRSR